jgi:hypothetical protein
VSVMIITAELIAFFERGSSLSTAIQQYSNSVQQSNTMNYLMTTLFYLSKYAGDILPAVEQAKLESVISNLQQAKNSLAESKKYLQVVDETSGVFSIGSLDTRMYRISEIFEQILGKVIKLKDGMNNPKFAATFSMDKDNFFYVTMNSANTLLPKLKVVQDTMYDQMVTTANSSLLTTSIVVSLLVFIVITAILTMVFLRQSFRLRMKLMMPFVMIPENTVKLYHAQSEYYVLLFSGMEDKHVDDLKTEVNSLRKVNDQAATGNNQLSYGKKKKRLIDRSMMQARTYILIGSLIVSVIAYCGSLLYINYFKSSRLNTTIPFSFLEKQRTLSYVGSLNTLFLTSINSTIQVGQKQIIDIANEEIQNTYKIDSSLTIVDANNLSNTTLIDLISASIARRTKS